MKNTLLALALVSSTSMATQHPSFQNNFFNSGFNKSVWSNFNDQFQKFNNDMRNIQNQNIFSAKANQYFDNATNNYIIEIAAKGLTKENLNISTKNNTLYIDSSIQQITNTQNSSQSSSSQFRQSYSLPNDADENNISAEFKKDQLIISIPKSSKPKPSINKIRIK